MIHRIEIYLDQVMNYAGLPPQESDQARNELADHLLSRVDELEAEGSTRDDAAFRAISEHGHPVRVGYSLRPSRRWVDVRMRGTARGVFAVGPRAVGVFSVGIISSGIVSCGVVSFGLISVGVISFALILGMGAISIGSISLGINALGLLAAGINTAGVLAGGVNSMGLWVFEGTNTLSYFTDTTVPSWLRDLGFMIGFSPWETVLSLMPFLLLFACVIAASIGFAFREYKRLQNSPAWLFLE